MDDRRAALADWLRDAAGTNNLEILAMDKLSGGAIQENWGLAVALDGAERDWVLRTDAPSGVSTSHGRVAEFALLKAAQAAGVTVPEPLFLNADPALLGKPFYVMTRIAGRAEGHVLTRDPVLQGAGGDRLVERLGAELARIHSIRPPCAELDFLPLPAAPPAPRTPPRASSERIPREGRRLETSPSPPRS